MYHVEYTSSWRMRRHLGIGKFRYSLGIRPSAERSADGQADLAVAMQEKKIDDLAVDVEIPLLVRTFRTDGTQTLVAIDAFADPENSSAVKYSSYAEAYTVKNLKNDNS